jgi:transitional endoplasmic reticulum ATPase
MVGPISCSTTCGRLKDALLFAQRYAPAVVFAEDVDRCIDKRDNAGNDLLNVIDGILTKNSQVITVLTTNFVEKLDKAMLRPGRLDAVISIHTPGPDAVGRLIRLYGRDLVKQDEPLDQVGEELAGNIPATIREVVERSKLAMIANSREQVTQEDLLIAGRGMSGHLALLAGKPDDRSLEEKVGEHLGALVLRAAKEGATHVLNDGSESLINRVEEIHSSVC